MSSKVQTSNEDQVASSSKATVQDAAAATEHPHPARLKPGPPTARDVRQLQQTMGNQAVGRLLTAPTASATNKNSLPVVQRKPDGKTNPPVLADSQMSADQNSSPGSTTNIRAKRQARSGAELEELAQDPGKAFDAWKKLSQMEQNAVTEKMRQRYGEPFTQQFLDEVKKGMPHREHRYYQPGSGPKPDQLTARGYRFAGKFNTGNAAFEVEVWVHPSGIRILRDVSTYTFGVAGPEKSPKSGTAAAAPAKIDPGADRDKLFGPVIAIRENVDATFGVGDMVLYKDGTAELFLEGTGGKSYVLYPIPGGSYAVYGPDGQRLNKAWQIPKSDFPDPKTDAIE